VLFRVFDKELLPALFYVLAVNRLVGPVKKGMDGNGRPLYAFDWLYDFADLALDYDSTAFSAKKFFLPYQETMATFSAVDRKDWRKEVDFNAYWPIVFFGMHPCDINALNKLDKVLIKSGYPNPYYAAKRKNCFIIGMECSPQPYCFCRSMGTHTATHGFDMFLTDIGESYFVVIQSAHAYEFLKNIETREPSTEDHSLYLQTMEKKNAGFTCQVDTTDLTKILDLKFESDSWRMWGERCLSCGTCANVCPTCYCYGVEEHIDLSLRGATKSRFLYSCNLIDFAEVAGGHNFRPDSHTRLKYRYYHKHRGFVEIYEEPLCVGCGRCGQACLADITVPDVINSIRQEGRGHESS